MPPSTSLAESQVEHERMQNLAAELRCLVCQNQTIADSNSGLAIDLRNQITEQIHRGKSDVDIKQYMVERYGEFVLYNPPFSAGNAALWIGPFLILLLGAFLTLKIIKRNTGKSKESVQKETPDPKRLLEIEQRYKQDT
jgi:cytochrome c-type biogenesis protein CcmH